MCHDVASGSSQGLFVKTIAPVVEDMLKMAAAMANKAVKNRRDVFKRFVHPNRRTRLDSLLPGNKRLFGGKLDDVCKALKDGGQVKKLSMVDPHLISHTMFLSSISPSSSRPRARGEDRIAAKGLSSAA